MKKAFTLVELTITMVIISAIAGAGLVNYSKSNESQTLEQAALTFRTSLNLVQTRALAGEKGDDTYCRPGGSGSVGKELQGWCLSPNIIPGANPANYGVYGVCGDASPFTHFPDPPMLFEMPSGIVLTAMNHMVATDTWVSGSGKMLIKPRTQGVQFATIDPNSIDQVAYCLDASGFALIGTNNIYRIRVTKDGEIIDDGIQSTCQP